MVQYYTLEQAAQILRTSPEKLKEMAKKNELRAFQDRGNLRFRVQEIDELARAWGLGSDPDLPLGESDITKPAMPPARTGGGKPTVHAPPGAPLKGEDESEEVPLGNEPPSTDKSTPRTPGGSKKPASSKSKLTKSPPPKPASDSDVRLVMDGGMDFGLDPDSDVKVAKNPASSPSKSPTRKPKPVDQPDSGVRIVPLEESSDSDVKLRKPSSEEESAVGEQKARAPSDSDIRIEAQPPVEGGQHPEIVTEEIDLDAESRKAAESTRGKPAKPRPANPSVLPTSSPFELSEPDFEVAGPTSKSPAAKAGDTDSSSDFELNIDSASPVELGSGEIPAIMQGEDEVNLGEGKGSGINLQDPADSGISLEQGGSDEIEFELSVDGGHTPKPAAKKPVKEEEDSSSSSEFELSLDQDDIPAAAEGSSSEFELNLDVDSGSDSVEAPKSDSDSEFELTLDEGGSLAVEGEDAAGEKDIFETEFEVPALDEESGSEAVALEESDSDEGSSDFDLSLEEQSDEVSGSDALPLEETSDEVPAAEGEHFGDMEEEPEPEEEEEEYPAEAVAAAPAPWGVIPAIALIPSVVILFVVGLMSFEMLQGLWGYHKPAKVSNLIIHPLAKQFDDSLPND
jgi:excisionase family DNA binding protein